MTLIINFIISMLKTGFGLALPSDKRGGGKRERYGRGRDRGTGKKRREGRGEGNVEGRRKRKGRESMWEEGGGKDGERGGRKRK